MPDENDVNGGKEETEEEVTETTPDKTSQVLVLNIDLYTGR